MAAIRLTRTWAMVTPIALAATQATTVAVEASRLSGSGGSLPVIVVQPWRMTFCMTTVVRAPKAPPTSLLSILGIMAPARLIVPVDRLDQSE